MPDNSRTQIDTARLLAEANRLRLKGRSDEALAELRKLLAVSPGHEAANRAMAEIIKSAGGQDQSLSALRRAAENAPADPAIWTRYVFELRLAGKKARARKAAGDARVSPSRRKALRDIAEGRSVPVDDIVQHVNRGELGLAWSKGLERLFHFPKDHRLLNLLGAVALADEDPTRAVPVLRRALAEQPGFEAAIGNLGLALLRQNRFSDAVAVLERPGRVPGALPAIRVNLASAYQKIGRWREADELTTELMSVVPGDSDLLGVRCKTLIALGRAGEAVELLKPLAASDDFVLHDVMAEALGETEGYAAGVEYLATLTGLPRDTEIRIVSLLAEWGETDAASKRARLLAEDVPADPRPFHLIGLFSKWEAEDPLIGSMQRAVNSEAIPASKRGTFGMALAKALIDTGDDDGAMEALHIGNDMLRSLYSYDVATDERHMRKIAGHWSADAIRERASGMDEPAPIFIVGLPRSGSTLAETILSRHPDVEPLGESPLAHEAASHVRLGKNPAEFGKVARDLAPAMTPETGRRVRTDKLLANFLNLGALAACFPKARFVEMRRDYRATCLSIYQADLGWAAHPYSMNLEELARYAIAYDRLMTHWSNVLNGRLIRLDYASLVSAPEDAIRRFLAELELDWHPDCLRPEEAVRRINTLSVGQARKPISKASLERWKRFEGGLSPLIGLLEEAGLL